MPRTALVAIAILAALLLKDAFAAYAWGALTPASHSFVRVVAGLAAGGMMVVGVACGMRIARLLALVLVLPQLLACMYYAGRLVLVDDPLPWILAGAHAVAVLLLYLPPSGRWFRARTQSLRQGQAYPFIAAAMAVAAAMPLLVMVAVPVGAAFGGHENRFGAAALYLYFLPAMALGRSHFMSGIGPGPFVREDLVLVGTFWAAAAIVLGLAAWRVLRGARVAAGTAGRDPGARNGALAMLLVLAAVAAWIVLHDVRDPAAPSPQATFDVRKEPALAGYPALAGRFDIRDEGNRFGIRSTGRWKIEAGFLEIVAERTEIWNRFPACARCPPLVDWGFELRNDGPGRIDTDGASGFGSMMPVSRTGPGGRLVAIDHRMVVPIARDAVRLSPEAPRQVVGVLPAGVLADYWLGLEVRMAGNSTYPANVTDPYLFTDPLAAKGLAPARCALVPSVAVAVERGCHAELAQLLQDPAHRGTVNQGNDRLRVYGKETAPIEVAVWREDLRAAEMLLANGADPNRVGFMGYTALMTAVDRGSVPLVQALLRHKPRIDERYVLYPGQDAGKTALIMAAADGKADIVRLLLEAGADRNIRSRDGYTAYEYAMRHGHRESAAVLMAR